MSHSLRRIIYPGATIVGAEVDLTYCSSARILKQGEVIMHYNILRSSIAGLFTKLRGSDLH